MIEETASSRAADRILALEKDVDELRRENQRLRERAMSLELERRRASEYGSIDQATGFRNEAAFRRYLREVIGILGDVGGSMALVAYDVDDVEALGRSYGERAKAEILQRAGAILRSNSPREALAFRVTESRFAFITSGLDRAGAETGAASALAALEAASIHEARVTASATVESLDAWAVNALDPEGTVDVLLEVIDSGIRAAKSCGGGRVASAGTAETGTVRQLPVVVLVEPDAFNASVIADLLKRHGMECAWRADGVTGLERIMESKPDAIISELFVPRLGGLEIRRRLLDSGRLEGLHRVPFILLAERKDDDSIKSAADLGVDRYIQKPYYMSELLAVVESLVRERPGDREAACP